MSADDNGWACARNQTENRFDVIRQQSFEVFGEWNINYLEYKGNES